MARLPRALRRALLAGSLFASVLAGGAFAIGQPASLALASPPAELISTNPAVGGFDAFFRPSISGDGNIVVFAEQPPSGTFVVPPQGWVRDRAANQLTKIPIPSGVDFNGVVHPVVSRDGCVVVFWSHFDNGGWTVFKWNRCGGSPPAPIFSDVAHNPNDAHFTEDIAVSADGRFVAIVTGLGQNRVIRVDTGNGNAIVSATPLARQGFVYVESVDIADNGAFVAAAAATTDNRFPQSVVGWTPDTGAVEVISRAGGGVAATADSRSPSVSADGRFVAFTSGAIDASGFVQFAQLYIRDRSTGVNHHVTVQPASDGIYSDPDLLPQGSQVAFAFEEGGDEPVGFRRAPGLIHTYEVFAAISTAGNFDSFSTEPVSFGTSDQLVSQGAFHPAISATGRFVTFDSGSDTEFGPYPSNPQRIDVWLRERVPALSMAPPLLDFGTLAVGTASGGLNAVVTNTSRVIVPIATVTPPAPPFALIGDSCSGAVLLPGQACVLTVRYAPTTPTTSNGQVAASGEGITVSSGLRGTGSTTPPPSTTPPQTTAPPGVTVPTTTTLPGALAIAPPTVDFGTVNAGDTTATQDLTVTNVGGGPVTITTAELSGADADQFAFDFTGCTGRTLAASATCVVPVAATPTHGGASVATFTIRGSGNRSASSTLKVGGTFTPTLLMKPGVLRPGQVGTIVGSGFPPSVAVQLALEGATPFVTITSDGSGALTVPYLVLPNGPRIGGQVLVAVDQPGLFSGVRTTFLVQPATFAPAGSVSPAITNGVRALVSRNG